MEEDKIYLPDYPDAYWYHDSLWKEEWVKQKNWPNEKYVKRIYGGINQIKWGQDEGKWEAYIPFYDEDEPDTDCKDLGIFNTKEEAMNAVVKDNHPTYSGWYW